MVEILGEFWALQDLAGEAQSGEGDALVSLGGEVVRLDRGWLGGIGGAGADIADAFRPGLGGAAGEAGEIVQHIDLAILIAARREQDAQVGIVQRGV